MTSARPLPMIMSLPALDCPAIAACTSAAPFQVTPLANSMFGTLPLPSAPLTISWLPDEKETTRSVESVATSLTIASLEAYASSTTVALVTPAGISTLSMPSEAPMRTRESWARMRRSWPAPGRSVLAAGNSLRSTRSWLAFDRPSRMMPRTSSIDSVVPSAKTKLSTGLAL